MSVPRVGNTTEPRAVYEYRWLGRLLDDEPIVTIPRVWKGIWENHTEYWKTLRRTNTFGEPYTIGFSWFQTFPTSKRLRWPIGCAMESPLPWVCTRKELMRGELTELMARAKECSSILPPWEIENKTTLQEMWLIMIKSDEWKQRPYSMLNPRQGWLPNGMEIKGE